MGADESISSVQFLQVNTGAKTILSSASGTISSVGGFGAHSERQKNRQRLFQLLKDVDGLSSFMQHLSGEFSLEGILFLMEVVQLQAFIKEQCRHDLISD